MAASSVHNTEEDIDTYAPPTSPTHWGAVYKHAAQIGEKVIGNLPEYTPVVGRQAFQRRAERLHATLDHKILVNETRCIRIKDIEVHIKNKLGNLTSNEDELKERVADLRHVVKDTEDMLAAIRLETTRFKNQLNRVQRAYTDCRRQIDALEERRKEDMTQKAFQAATAKADLEASRAKKRAGIKP